MAEFNIDENKFLNLMLDSILYPIVFVDKDHIIRYLNKTAKKEYYQVRKLKNIVGRALFSCHPPYAKITIMTAYEKLVNGENDVYLYYSEKIKDNLYLTAVRDEEDNLIGYYQRYEHPYEPKVRDPKQDIVSKV